MGRYQYDLVTSISDEPAFDRTFINEFFVALFGADCLLHLIKMGITREKALERVRLSNRAKTIQCNLGFNFHFTAMIYPII